MCILCVIPSILMSCVLLFQQPDHSETEQLILPVLLHSDHAYSKKHSVSTTRYHPMSLNVCQTCYLRINSLYFFQSKSNYSEPVCIPASEKGAVDPLSLLIQVSCIKLRSNFRVLATLSKAKKKETVQSSKVFFFSSDFNLVCTCC